MPYEKLLSDISKELGVTLKGRQVPLDKLENRPGASMLAKPTDFYSSIERYFDSVKQNKFDAASFKHIISDPQKIRPVARDLFNLDELVSKAEAQGFILKEEILAHVHAMKPNVYPFIQDLQDIKTSFPYGTTDEFLASRRNYLENIKEERDNLRTVYREYKQSVGKPHPEALRFKNLSKRVTVYGNAMVKGLQNELLTPIDNALAKAHAKAHEISQRAKLPPPQGIISNEEMQFLKDYTNFAGSAEKPVRDTSSVIFINKPGVQTEVKVALETTGFDADSFIKIGVPVKEAQGFIETMEKYNQRYKNKFNPLRHKLEDIYSSMQESDPRSKVKRVVSAIRDYRKKLSDLETEALEPVEKFYQNTEYSSHLPEDLQKAETFENVVLTPGYQLSEEENPRWSQNLRSLLNPSTQRHYTGSRNAPVSTVYSFTRGGTFHATFPGDSTAKPAVMALEVQSDPINIIGENPSQVIPMSKITDAIKQHLESEKTIPTDETLKSLISKFKKANRRLTRETGISIMSQSDKHIMKMITEENLPTGRSIEELREKFSKKLRSYMNSKDMSWHDYSLLERRYNNTLDILRTARRRVKDIKDGDELSRVLSESLYIESPYMQTKANLYKELNAITLIKKAINTGVDRVVFTPPATATMQWGDKAMGWKNEGDVMRLYIQDLSPKTSKLLRYLKNPMTQTKVEGKTFLYQKFENTMSGDRTPNTKNFNTEYDRLVDIIESDFASQNWSRERRKAYAIDLLNKMRAVKEGMIMPHYQRDYVLHETTAHESVQKMLNHFGIKMERVRSNVHPDLGGEQESWGIRLNDSIKKAFKEGKIPFLTLLAGMLPTLKSIVYDNAEVPD